jgi:cytochrome c oxidase assembly factor CtaG
MDFGARVAYLVLHMPVNAAVGLAIYFAPSVLYAHYATLQRPWGPDAFTDQQVGGLLMWGAGDLLLLLAIPAVIAVWMRADARRSATTDARLLAVAAVEGAGPIDERIPIG